MSRNKEMGAFVKTKKGNKTRVYSIFQIGTKWFKKCYFSKVDRKLVSDFLIKEVKFNTIKKYINLTIFFQFSVHTSG